MTRLQRLVYSTFAVGFMFCPNEWMVNFGLVFASIILIDWVLDAFFKRQSSRKR
jgi:hypothetical protein